MFSIVSVLILSSFALNTAAQYSATFSPDKLPDKTQEGQDGTNNCGTKASQNSMCQNAYINSVEDFCLFAPPEPGPESVIGNTERIEVSWCMKDGYGTRLIPDGTIQGAHFVKTPDYVQITGTGDLTKLNIPAGDAGGELDPHGADGNGNPIGGLVFSSGFGSLQQMHEWTNFMSASEFCFRACNPKGSNAPGMCQHIYDVMGCQWNMPANYAAGTFENCDGESGEPMGVYGGSTFHQGDANTPPPHPAPASSNCKALTTISNGLVGTASASTTRTGTTSTSTTNVSATSVSTTTVSTTSARSAKATSGSSTKTSASGATDTSNGAKASQQTGNTGSTIANGGWERLMYTAAGMLICSLIGAVV